MLQIVHPLPKSIHLRIVGSVFGPFADTFWTQNGSQNGSQNGTQNGPQNRTTNFTAKEPPKPEPHFGTQRGSLFWEPKLSQSQARLLPENLFATSTTYSKPCLLLKLQNQQIALSTESSSHIPKAFA